MAIEINDLNYKEIIEQNDKPVLIDFWAEWCGPCRMISPTIEELSKEYENKAIIGKVNVDENPEITSKFSIRSIPTLIFFKNGQIVDKVIGVTQKSTLKSILDKLI